MKSLVMKTLMTVLCMLAWGTAAAAPAPAGPAPQALPTWTEPLTGAEFVALPKACFQMGSAKLIEPPWDSFWARLRYKGHLAENEQPQHEVCVDQFWMAKKEVTEGDWHKVMGGEAPKGSGSRVKVNVTWDEANEFARRLSAKSGGKFRLRLPTEAEWEYACRAGDTSEGVLELPEIERQAWTGEVPNSRYEPRDVGLLAPNAFGLYDMLGNAWEWTQDSYLADAYTRHSLYNPIVQAEGKPRVMRGGSHRTEQYQVRCTMRSRYEPGYTMDTIGMRLVREP